MIAIGAYNTLGVARDTSVGLFLTDGEGQEILLPRKYVPEGTQEGDMLRVFCYLDHEERPVATTLEPAITRDAFGSLRVAEVTRFGAFMDWGLEKHLLVPYREQPTPMEEGRHYPVYCYLDPKSGRLVASGRLERFLSNEDMTLKAGEEVSLLVYRKTDLGFEVVVNQAHKGLVFHDQVFRALEPGDAIKGYVKTVRPDRKLDVVLEPLGHTGLEPAAARILEALEASGGFLDLHDGSDPGRIQEVLKMSKKRFKKGLGILYKARKIELAPDGVRLLRQS
ncbi:S1-like domain-containing RNA-binding protein [Robiginitalea sp. M366]|uniref:CvfB family protein n=1 Tax=Robiginitalea aestuariiviva TaxID=3036903 RepID=UPI00240D6C3C|nr:S1-like domain-containing RNA-binding protein [Robiginitalea aestuariiviva]MDG1573077.1 S1-like domain-containing RNA-binding protein [Robiginitalea aestuariiviva]